MRSPRFVLLAATAAMALAPMATALADTAAPVPVASFAPGVALYNAAGASTLGSEPSIHIDSLDNVYVSAPAGVPTGGCPFWSVHPDSVNAAGKAYEYRGTIDTDRSSVGGGDCDISSTPTTGAFDDVSVTSLSLANLTSNVTTDGGATWRPVANSASQQIFAVDRQWQGSDAALGRHYLSVHDLATSNIQVSVSTDGGYQYVQNTPAINPTTNRKALSSGVSISVVDGSNHFGPMVVDQTTHKIYIPFLAPLEGTTGFNEHAFYVAEGDPCAVSCTAGQPAGPITWTSHLAFAAPAGDNLANDFPSLALDRNGSLYATFTGAVTSPASPSGSYDTSRIFVLHSAPHDASHWSTPQAVDLGTGNANVFPWLVAGTKGNVGVAWYASTLATSTTCPGAGTAANNPVSDNCRNLWHVAYAQSSDGDAATPSWTVSDVSGLVHKGPICNQGLSCPAGTRTMLDFFDVAMDSMGRPNIVYVSDTRAPDTADVQYTRQCTGSSLTGTDLPGVCQPIGSSPVVCAANAAYTDAAGDATGALGTQTPGPNDAALDIVGGSLSTTATALVLKVHLNDLTNESVGQIVEQHFKLAGKEYWAMAQRATGGSAVTYDYGDLDATTGSRNTLGSTTGTFDDTTDIVSIDVPRTVAPAALADGEPVSSVVVTTRRDGVVLIPDADTAIAPCTYAMGASVPDAVLPEVPYAALVPIAAVAVLGGVFYRRRRRPLATSFAR